MYTPWVITKIALQYHTSNVHGEISRMVLLWNTPNLPLNPPIITEQIAFATTYAGKHSQPTYLPAKILITNHLD